MKRYLFIFAVALALIPTLSLNSESCFAQTASTKSASLGSSVVERGGEVDALLSASASSNSPGTQVLVIQNGNIAYSRGFGLANLETKSPIGPTTPFELASFSKQFTAMAIMMLAESGKLKLDDSLASFFPELPDYAKTITVRHLLNHTSGLPDVISPRLNKPGYQPSSKDLIKLLAEEKTPRFKPGEKFEYNNTAYVVLALTVEKASGQSFPDFMKKKIFAPLGMNHTVIWDETQAKIENNSLSYAPEGKSFKHLPFGSDIYLFGAKGVVTTAEDLFKWDQALYKDKLVSAVMIKEAFTPTKLNSGRISNYGYGWGIGRDHGLNTVGHGGGYMGFRTNIVRYPDQHFTVIILSNSAETPVNLLTRKIARIYLHDQMVIPVATKIDTRVLPELVGRYEFDPRFVQNFIADVSSEAEELYIKPSHERERRKLIPLSTSEFYDEEGDTRLKFQRDEKGRVTGFLLRESTGDGVFARKLQLGQPSLKGNTTFRLKGYPNAKIVALAGSFNEWNQSSMLFAKEDNDWICRIDLAPGKYTYKFVIDGIWITDPENPNREDDGNGNINSVLVIKAN